MEHSPDFSKMGGACGSAYMDSQSQNFYLGMMTQQLLVGYSKSLKYDILFRTLCVPWTHIEVVVPVFLNSKSSQFATQLYRQLLKQFNIWLSRALLELSTGVLLQKKGLLHSYLLSFFSIIFYGKFGESNRAQIARMVHATRRLTYVYWYFLRGGYRDAGTVAWACARCSVHYTLLSSTLYYGSRVIGSRPQLELLRRPHRGGSKAASS